MFENNEWRYFQLKHFIAAIPHPVREGDDLTAFERLCTTEKACGGISRIYKILMEGKELEVRHL